MGHIEALPGSIFLTSCMQQLPALLCSALLCCAGRCRALQSWHLAGRKSDEANFHDNWAARWQASGRLQPRLEQQPGRLLSTKGCAVQHSAAALALHLVAGSLWLYAVLQLVMHPINMANWVT